jgi:hypothetical protein
MAGLVPAIQVFFLDAAKTWMPGTSPGMTTVVESIAVQKTHCMLYDRCSVRIRQQSCPICVPNQNSENGRRTMARPEFGYLPRENPCAQCGKPIAAPDWIEAGPRGVAYLWSCHACNYRFEAVAVFSDRQSEALAA